MPGIVHSYPRERTGCYGHLESATEPTRKVPTMPDLDVVAVLTAKPGSEDIVRDALTELVEPTRAESGCISYDLFASNVDSTVFITVEKWTSQTDLDAHLTTPHVAKALGTAGEHLAVPPAIHPLSPVGS